MKAMVLAAGFGTRLGELTKETPKALITAGGKPMLAHVFSWLKAHGVTEIIVNLHYLGDKIRKFVEEGGGEGLKVHFSQEKEILGTGGGLQKVESFFPGGNDFLLVNADIFCDLDLTRLATSHSAAPGRLATLAVMERKDSSYLIFSAENSLSGYRKSKGEPVLVRQETGGRELAFCGVQCLNPGIFACMEGLKPPFSLIDVYLKAALKRDAVKGYRIEPAFWIDMGSLTKLHELEKHLEKHPGKELP